ncbi:HECT E3 ubiquitin ligase [Phytophthora cinnamomi]|uniref:HECT E3 ubiquitin ligase n=1 Tax=Phytophthora cinnamomi TaxID=4785 RepID=UPI00355A54DD|nr:HECT E3 ubiquitin ligase [Phytophthora cinnamomi]
MQAASVGAHAPRAPPSDKEKRLMDVLLQAADARVAPLLACVQGWPLEAQADLANWRAVLLKLHRLLLAALQQCPRLLLVEAPLEPPQEPVAAQTEQELAELVFEILKFSAFLLENAANKAVYPSAEPVLALLAARNERVVAEATKVVAMLALPPQVHRYAADPTSFVDPAAGRNNLLRRRLLTVAQGHGAPKNSLEVVDYLNATSADAARSVEFQFYSSEEQEGDEETTARVVSVAIPPYEEVVGASTSPADAACAAATACERLIEQGNIPKRLHFKLFTQVRACYAARSALARENLVVERLHALLALFSLFSDAWDVTNYVEQHPELTRGIVELIRVESIERVPVRVRITALLVLTALVNDRVGRAGALPVVYRNGTNLDALLELLELILSPLERLHKPSNDEEKKEGESEASTPEPSDEWVAVPAVELDEARMGEIVAVLAMDLCTAQMQERTLAVLKLLNHVRGNRELVIRAVVRYASMLARVEQYKGDSVPAEITAYESSAVLPSAQDELKLLRLLHSLSDVCENTAEFTECCQTIGLDPLWDALSVSLTEARAKGGLDDQDSGASAASAAAASQASPATSSESQGAAVSDDAEGTVIEGKSAGASCAMAALLARFLPMVEAFFVVNARDAASMSLRVPDSSEREEAVVAALRVGGFDGADATALMGTEEQKASPKSALKRSSSALSSMSEASETMRLANFVESNRVLLNLLVREKPSLLDTSLAALIKIPRCRAYLAFDNKRTYFHSAMKRLRQSALRNHGGGSSSVRIPVRREHIFEDSYYALRMRSGAELRRKLHISFTGEEGIDAGGVTREWYMILAREMFNPNYVLFTSAADSPTFQPNPLSYVNKDHLSYFEFVGKVLGKAVADGQLLDAHFTRSFYKHILQLPISYHDMEAIDPEYYRNLHSILDNSIVDLGLDLTFSAEQSNFGKVEVVDLIPNGRNVTVTDENKMEYVKLVTHHRMATGIRQQIDAFLKGFHQLVPPELIAIFNENELELLISGMPEIDIDDLKANTEYANYKPTDSVIRWFWNVLYSFTHEERALFLQFVTGTSKVPLEGFKALEGMRGTQKFNIHKAFGNNSALPFNQLDLPEYESEEKLKQCLLLAIREGSEGFGFG